MGVFFSEAELSGAIDRNCPKWLLEADRPIYIFGAAHCGRTVLAELSRRPEMRKRVAGFLDNNPSLIGSAIEGVPVFPAASVTAGNGGPFVIVSAFDQRHHAGMYGECHRLGYEYIPWNRAILEAGRADGALAVFIESQARAVAALDLWADEESRCVYRSHIRLQVTGSFADLSEKPAGPQYFHSRVPYRYYRSFLDGGAYQGDTLKVFRSYCRNDFDRYYAFEPSTVSRRVLTEAAENDLRVEIHEFALRDNSDPVYFMDDNALGSAVVAAAGAKTVTVPSRTIDSVLDGRPVTLIKLDVESSEPEALRGAIETMTRQRPALAVCTYHQLDHQWEIPLWIRDLDLGYRFHCAHYSDTLAELVCYAVPE